MNGSFDGIFANNMLPCNR